MNIKFLNINYILIFILIIILFNNFLCFEYFEKKNIKKKKNKLITKIKNLIRFSEDKPSSKFYNDFYVNSISNKLIKNSGFNKWVFSSGGCGTNYIRKLINIYKIKKNNHNIDDVIRSIHIFKPPQLPKNFLAI